MHEREASLVADRVIAPNLGDVHAVLHRQPPRDVDAAGRYIEVEGGPGPSEVRPLSHRFEVIDRFGRLNLDRTHQSFTSIDRCEHEIRKNLDLPDAHGNRLVLANVGHDVVLALEFCLQEPDDTVVLELLADGPYQNWTHFASPAPDSTPNQSFMKTGNFVAAANL
jgi:hypothetical protein